jgi:hypothetical protein
MVTNYEKLMHENLSKLFAQLPPDLENLLGAEKKGDHFYFRAFGENCCVGPERITLSNKPSIDPRGLLISLYALHANPEPIQIEPFKSFKDLPGSMPYQVAFSSHSENILVPHVPQISETQEQIKELFGGQQGMVSLGSDFSLVLYPLPKIVLCYIFYLPDEEFPASARCLFSANALSYMPLDGLADVAEYTSKRIIQLMH